MPEVSVWKTVMLYFFRHGIVEEINLTFIKLERKRHFKCRLSN